ncbi:MAG TPA: peptidase S10 [Methylocystis sp.]|nr:peptidase S10 [Methylocystis sp.]
MRISLGLILVGVCALLANFGGLARAEEAASPPRASATPPAPASAPSPASAPAPLEARKLPADKVTTHTLALHDRKLAFKANVSTIHITDVKGGPEADIVTTAYTLDGADLSKRPITFAFNGGPGAASAFLQLGALGPWRLPFDFEPSAPPIAQDNADTWLDFTDLVFVDPPGTGWSRIVATGEDAKKRIWSVDGDIDILAAAVRQWLAANERMGSPKYIVGESYGGFRGPRLAEALIKKEGVGVSGLVLVSPVLDFGAFFGGDAASSPLAWAARLPTLAAVAREAKGPLTRAAQADVEAYAAGDYVLDFLRGARDPAAVERMSARVAAFTGLESALVKRLQGRVNLDAFEREFLRAQGRVLAPHDASIEAYDPEPAAYESKWLDPVIDGLNGPLTSAVFDLYARRLGWKSDLRYELLSHEVGRAWDWGRSLHGIESESQLRRLLALDPHLRVLIAHGFSDLVTPYFAAQLIINQIPDYGPSDRVTLAVYPGGHMHYARDDSRKALRRDAQKLYEGK